MLKNKTENAFQSQDDKQNWHDRQILHSGKSKLYLKTGVHLYILSKLSVDSKETQVNVHRTLSKLSTKLETVEYYGLLHSGYITVVEPY